MSGPWQKKAPGYRICAPISVKLRGVGIIKDPDKIQEVYERLARLLSDWSLEDLDDFGDFERKSAHRIGLENILGYNNEEDWTDKISPENSFYNLIADADANLSKALRELDSAIYFNGEGRVPKKVVTRDIDKALGIIYKSCNIISAKISDKKALLQNYYRELAVEVGTDFFKSQALNYLRDELGYHDLYDQIDRSKSLQEIAILLKNIRRQQLPLWELERSLVQRIKSGEQGLRNLLKKARSEAAQMIEEIVEFSEYMMPTYQHLLPLKKALDEVISNVGELFILGKDTTLLVDCSFNPKIDYSAGIVSRDCTQNRPLPFYHPLVHNFKIYSGADHLGNIYVLENRATDGISEVEVFDEMMYDEDTIDEGPHYRRLSMGRAILHIEAFQCPSFDQVRAGAFLRNFLPKLKKAYQDQQGVKGTVVTANKTSEYNSNYQPIQDAMDEFLTQDEVVFQYPGVDIKKGFRGFQSGRAGTAYAKPIIYK